jgi:hypothetical protein
LTKTAQEKTGGGGSFDFWNPEKAGEVLAGKISVRKDGLKSKRYKSRPPYSMLVVETGKGPVAVTTQGYKLAEMMEKEDPQKGQLVSIVFKGLVKTKGGTMKNFDYAIR